MDLGLEGRVAVVTGASRGIGRAVAERLAEEGAQVVAVARGTEDLERAAGSIPPTRGRRVLAVAADTRDRRSLEAMAGRVRDEFGRIDALVNCAARPAAQLPAVTWMTLDETALLPEIDTKVLGYLRCVQAVAPSMIEQGGGRIVNVGGGTSLRTGNTVATVRNVAVTALTKNLADELGPHGVSVNAVHPDMTRTERTDGQLAARAEERGTSIAAIEAEVAQRNTIRRVVDAGEVADVIAFLVSPRSIAINGDSIAVGGGRPGVIRY